MKTTSVEARANRSVLLMLVLTAGACAEGGGTFTVGAHHYEAERLQQWALPKELGEISGLTLDPQGRLFAHDDERARIYQLDYVDGGVIKRFDLGDPPLRDDFEGITWAGKRLYLVTSDGVLLSAEEGDDGSSVAYERYDTGLGERCEIEGLHHDAREAVLLMACKTLRAGERDGQVTVLAWSLRTRRADPARDIRVRLASRQALNPSGLTRCPRSGHLILVAARQRAVIELDAAGTPRQILVLSDAARHPQMEGIEMTAQGDLIISDEGGVQRGRLGVYRAER